MRGGLGLFTGRPAYVWISNQYGNTGVDFTRINAAFNTNQRIPFVRDPDNQPTSLPGFNAAVNRGRMFIALKPREPGGRSKLDGASIFVFMQVDVAVVVEPGFALDLEQCALAHAGKRGRLIRHWRRVPAAAPTPIDPRAWPSTLRWEGSPATETVAKLNTPANRRG